MTPFIAVAMASAAGACSSSGANTDGDPSGQTPLKIYLDDIVWDTAAPTPDGE